MCSSEPLSACSQAACHTYLGETITMLFTSLSLLKRRRAAPWSLSSSRNQSATLHTRTAYLRLTVHRLRLAHEAQHPARQTLPLTGLVYVSGAKLPLSAHTQARAELVGLPRKGRRLDKVLDPQYVARVLHQQLAKIVQSTAVQGTTYINGARRA